MAYLSRLDRLAEGCVQMRLEVDDSLGFKSVLNDSITANLARLYLQPVAFYLRKIAKNLDHPRQNP